MSIATAHLIKPLRNRTLRTRVGPCQADRHTPTNDSWNRGCRCPAAMEAHEVYLKRRQEARAFARAGGVCLAPKHDTLYAYEQGCRCPRARQVKRSYRAAQAAWGGWNHWRGPKHRVSRINLSLLLSGIMDSPTWREKMVADIRLRQVRVVDGLAWSRPLMVSEIAERLGGNDKMIHRLRADRIRMADNRHLRRLADVRWKAVRADRADERKKRVRAEHEAGHAARAERELAWKRHCRTARRLRESQARAKVVALAVQRRG